MNDKEEKYSILTTNQVPETVQKNFENSEYTPIFIKDERWSIRNISILLNELHD